MGCIWKETSLFENSVVIIREIGLVELKDPFEKTQFNYLGNYLTIEISFEKFGNDT